jgi:hypothetical protein
MVPEGNVAWAGGLPLELIDLLPAGYDVLALASARLTGGRRDDYTIAIGRHGHQKADSGDEPAPARPSSLFRPVERPSVEDSKP